MMNHINVRGQQTPISEWIIIGHQEAFLSPRGNRVHCVHHSRTLSATVGVFFVPLVENYTMVQKP